MTPLPPDETPPSPEGGAGPPTARSSGAGTHPRPLGAPASSPVGRVPGGRGQAEGSAGTGATVPPRTVASVGAAPPPLPEAPRARPTPREAPQSVSAELARLGDAVGEMQHTVARRVFIDKGDHDALRRSVTSLGNALHAHIEKTNHVLRKLDERRSLTETHYVKKDAAHDKKLRELEAHASRVRAWKVVGQWVGAGTAISIVNYLLNHLDPLARIAKRLTGQ